jgi:hypothetical protein
MTRKKHRVVGVQPRVIEGTVTAVLAALAVSVVRTAVNTVFVERETGRACLMSPQRRQGPLAGNRCRRCGLAGMSKRGRNSLPTDQTDRGR